MYNLKKKEMATLAVEMERAISAGDKKVTGFKGQVRSLETVLEKGDEFTIEPNAQVWEQKLPGGVAQYMFVTTKKGEVRKLYPSVFTKRRIVVDDNDVVTTDYMSTNGTATELFKQSGSIEAAMKSLEGKTLVVSDVINFKTTRYGAPGETTNTNVYTIDLK